MLKQGSVIRAWIEDPQGGNPKPRPLVVVTPTDDIRQSAVLVAVAITGRFSDPLADDEVPLPYHPAGKANSGLRKPCVAKCSWMAITRLEDVLEVKGFLNTERLTVILQKIGRHNLGSQVD